MSDVQTNAAVPSSPAFKYDAKLANEIELKWQDAWDKDKTYYTPNPVGDMSQAFDKEKEKLYILDISVSFRSGTARRSSAWLYRNRCLCSV